MFLMGSPSLALLAVGALVLAASGVSARPVTVVVAQDEEALVQLAAKEIQRYIYLLSREFPKLQHEMPDLPADADVIVVGHLALDLAATHDTAPVFTHKEHHVLKTIRAAGAPVHLVMASSDIGVLYGAYRLCEAHGVRFRLHGDVVPAGAWHGVVPLDVSETPRFDVRGMHPFHDFAEGPDWWTEDDYKVFFTQQTKMRMNFFGLHTYPYNKYFNETATDEPTVWVGLPSQVNPDGSITDSGLYPTSWQSTLREQWAYLAVKTSDFHFGGKYLFETDCYGSPAQVGHCPFPLNKKEESAMLTASAQLLNASFTYARRLGIKTCVGNEAPLAIPFNNTKHSAQEFYEGTFKRIMDTYPIDYYWIWTPEAWEWESMLSNSTDFKVALADFDAALVAHDVVKAEFDLVSNGWVLGPLPNRSIFDRALSPRYAAMASLDQDVGNYDVDPAYKEVVNHKKWVIPWMEDDPGLTVSQLWVNRTLNHVAQALNYSCNGVLGIHWRTREVSPQVSAMAQSLWAPVEQKAFWHDWATAEFGPEVADAATEIFSTIESFNLPRPVNWDSGPGGMSPTNTSYSDCDLTSYSFVDDVCALVPKVTDALARERIEFWCNSFQYMRLVQDFECEWFTFDMAMVHANATSHFRRRIIAEREALPARIRMVQKATALMTLQLQTVSTRGELGTFYNLQTHSLIPAFRDWEPELLRFLGIAELPAEAIPPTDYAGPAKLIVPTVRTTLLGGDPFWIQAIHLSEPAYTAGMHLHTRPLGSTTQFETMPMAAITPGRPVYQLRTGVTESFEYYISDDTGLVWPPGAPANVQTVVLG